MPGRESEAERLRRCRLMFDRSNAERISMLEAGQRIETEASLNRIRARAERLAAIRNTPLARPAEQPARPTLWYQDPER